MDSQDPLPSFSQIPGSVPLDVYVEGSNVFPSQVLNNPTDSNSNNNPSQQNLPSEVTSTTYFMKQIDLRCDDHLSHYKSDIQATRYCSTCRVLCCDSCVIEFHNEHIQSAKTKIEEYFHQRKSELEELKTKVSLAVKFKVNESEINNVIDTHYKIIDSYFTKRKITFEEMKTKIDMLLNEEQSVQKKMKSCVEMFYNEEGMKRLSEPLNQNDVLLNKIHLFLKEWNNMNKTDKVNALKNQVVENLAIDAEINANNIKQQAEVFKTKAKVVDAKIKDILRNLAFTEKVNDFMAFVQHVNVAHADTKVMLSKLKYDNIEEGDDNKMMQQHNVQMNNNNNNQGFNLFQKKNEQNVPMQQQQQQQFMNSSGVPPPQQQQQFNRQVNQFNNNNNNVVPMQQQPQQQPQHYQQQQQQEVPFNYDLFIGIKPKSNEIIIYNPSTKSFNSVLITQDNFQNKSETFVMFPDHSKYINLGSSILITGGYINKQLTSQCFLIIVSPSNQSYEVTILPYNQMIQPRERHNIVFLPDKKLVLTCSGFFNKGSEYTNIEQGTWTSLGDLNESRGNATIAYVNNQYVFVIGGYRMIKQNGINTGVYLGDAEYFDMNNKSQGWRMTRFRAGELKLSAMGVFNVSPNTLLLCGGFDGKQYKKEVLKMDITDLDNPVIEPLNVFLPGTFIFLHNSFLKHGDAAMNMELSMNIIDFNITNWVFNAIPYIA